MDEYLKLVQSHTQYTVKCECGEYLLKRSMGFMSEREAWERHFAKVLFDHFNPPVSPENDYANGHTYDRT